MKPLPNIVSGEKPKTGTHTLPGSRDSRSGSSRNSSSGQQPQGMKRVSYCAPSATKPNSGGTSKGHPEVPPDNNQAERSLRLAVTKRKVSGGSRSLARLAQTGDLLSVVQTCRRQGRSVLTFFKQALIANSGSGNSRPSLLPQPST